MRDAPTIRRSLRKLTELERRVGSIEARIEDVRNRIATITASR